MAWGKKRRKPPLLPKTHRGLETKNNKKNSVGHMNYEPQSGPNKP